MENHSIQITFCFEIGLLSILRSEFKYTVKSITLLNFFEAPSRGTNCSLQTFTPISQPTMIANEEEKKLLGMFFFTKKTFLKLLLLSKLHNN